MHLLICCFRKSWQAGRSPSTTQAPSAAGWCRGGAHAATSARLAWSLPGARGASRPGRGPFECPRAHGHAHLVLDAGLVEVVAADGAGVGADGPAPHGNGAPLLDLEALAAAGPLALGAWAGVLVAALLLLHLHPLVVAHDACCLRRWLLLLARAWRRRCCSCSVGCCLAGGEEEAAPTLGEGTLLPSGVLLCCGDKRVLPPGSALGPCTSAVQHAQRARARPRFSTCRQTVMRLSDRYGSLRVVRLSYKAIHRPGPVSGAWRARRPPRASSCRAAARSRAAPSTPARP